MLTSTLLGYSCLCLKQKCLCSRRGAGSGPMRRGVSSGTCGAAHLTKPLSPIEPAAWGRVAASWTNTPQRRFSAEHTPHTSVRALTSCRGLWAGATQGLSCVLHLPWCHSTCCFHPSDSTEPRIPTPHISFLFIGCLFDVMFVSSSSTSAVITFNVVLILVLAVF